MWCAPEPFLPTNKSNAQGDHGEALDAIAWPQTLLLLK